MKVAVLVIILENVPVRNVFQDIYIIIFQVIVISAALNVRIVFQIQILV